MGGRWLCLAMVAGALGCGRFGFDSLAEDTDAQTRLDAQSGLDAQASEVDATDGGTMTVTVGSAADTALNSFAPDLNYGGAQSFNVRASAVNDFVGLLRFAPAAAGTVTSAELHLTTSSAALSQGEVVLYEVLEPWDEGTQVGGSGVANWNQRQGGTGWTTAGCGSGSRADAELARFAPLSANTTYVIALPVALVQGWVDAPSSQYGLALVAVGTGAGDAVGFWSREAASDSPELRITLQP